MNRSAFLETVNIDYQLNDLLPANWGYRLGLLYNEGANPLPFQNQGQHQS